MNGNRATTPGSGFNPLGSTGSQLMVEENRLRRASPDSDALVSSDEEAEHNQHSYFSQHKNSAISALSSRRPSYAAEFQNRQMNYSVTGGGPLSPTTSHPSAPSGDTAAWAAGLQGAGQSLAPIWNSIWNNEPSRKSPPGPLDVRRSSVAGISTQSPLFVGSEALPSPTTMPPSSGDFPIPIPLQPQLRNYRSMSFSVGQQPRELDERPRLSPPVGGPRPHAAPGLHHRPSRPSLLSGEQYPGESTPLRSVFETEDDDDGEGDHLAEGLNGYPQHSNGATATQQALQMRARYESMRLRNRSASTANITLGFGGMSSSGYGGGRDGEKNFSHEEYESALADDDELDYHHYSEQRRFSEAPPRSLSIYAENQRLENLRRQHWQSPSGPFGGPESGSQSRRHSFAGRLPMGDGLEKEFGTANDLLGKRTASPPRYRDNGMGSIGNRGNYLSLTDPSISEASGKENFYLNDERSLRQHQNFSSNKLAGIGPSPGTPPNQHHLQQLKAYQAPTRIPSPPPTGSHRGLMGLAPHHTQQPRSQQLLYFVTFKAQRGDVFYVQEGTGLRVRNGDLVIVEADRGTDLGTVVAENITWQQAKDMKEHHAKEQYNWLMMFATRRPTVPGASPNGAGNIHNGGGASTFGNGNTGAMPATHGPMQGQEVATTELKPKMIKRLAQVHEIQTLRDKEANEAKAKRVCQQKVLEHRLPMEILDAEFQMYDLPQVYFMSFPMLTDEFRDWKKLTFYYFADSYINFNSLVTDLFKVYKTRIWMSAMNPASFAHPTSLTASGALGTISEPPSDQQSQMMHHSQFSGINQVYPGYGPPASNGAMMGAHTRGHQQTLLQQMAPSQNPMLHQIASGFPPRHSPHGLVAAHQDFSHLPQQQLNGYNHGQSYMNGNSGNHHNQSHLGNNVDGHTTNGNSDAWMNLPGLSLNSH
ncbi:hypothetical protein Q9L58_000457 [Maublancomyces gigas]|uniref:PSP1 C-terminal domain-containing protein n=1 Tax=Discina gigas TaxID=1032678 RepID=A0ABR3GX12_9PEZI